MTDGPGSASERDPLHLFEGFGIEIEYMIVDVASLSIRPIADALLRSASDEIGEDATEAEVDMGPLSWSNELALHVVELKTNGPAVMTGLAPVFQEHVGRVNALLEPFDARLLPTGMHPWMDPESELRLWPHEYNRVYRAFDRIFRCAGHGWANLQSTHINLPFANDDEFGRLHAAVRLLLPLLPGIAASSPFVDESYASHLDARLEAYRHNAARVPSVSGVMIPEPAFTRSDYERGVLGRIYRDLEPHDPEGLLRHEWVNARGAIARFDRMALEIRLLDTQECPAADLAVAAAVVAVARAGVEERWLDTRRQRRWDEHELADILTATITDADRAVISNRAFLDAFGFPERGKARLGEVWQHLIESLIHPDPGAGVWRPWLDAILEEGCLARRIRTAVAPGTGFGAGRHADRDRLHAVYGRLAECLARGEAFREPAE